MHTLRWIRLEIWFALSGAWIWISISGMGHYNRLWRDPNRGEMNTKVTHFKVVPDVVKSRVNLSFINVQYRQTITILLGNKVKPEAIEDPPSNITWPAKPDTLYTLFLVDPDDPFKKPKTVHEYAHWIVGNIPGNEVDKGETIYEYVGYRAPVVDHHPHRYVFLVYSQPEKEPIHFNETRLTKKQVFEREIDDDFYARKFAARYNMTHVAINFYLVYCEKAWEPDVPDF